MYDRAAFVYRAFCGEAAGVVCAAAETGGSVEGELAVEGDRGLLYYKFSEEGVSAGAAADGLFGELGDEG